MEYLINYSIPFINIILNNFILMQIVLNVLCTWFAVVYLDKQSSCRGLLQHYLICLRTLPLK